MRLAPDALLDDGLLDMVAISKMLRVSYAWNLSKVFRGTHVRLKTVEIDRLSEAVVSADRPFTMYADGDPIGELPVRVRALPGAIRVLTPPTPLQAFAHEQHSEEGAAPGAIAAAAGLTGAHPQHAAGPHTLA
jgi:diacylglycerol kinase family enzyme